MANTSIYAAFERMWQHVTATLKNKADKEDSVTLPKTVSGNIITLNDSSEAAIGNLKIYGKTTQETITGKNLFDVSRIANTTELQNDNGTITVTAPSSSTAVSTSKKLSELAPTLIVGNAYILTFSTTGTEKYIYLSGDAKMQWTNGTTKTITQAMLDANVYLYASGVSTTAEISNMMIRLASITDATYEPYTGGIPSPNPEYPQPLESVGNGGSVGITVTGKNLFGGEALADKVVEAFKGVKDTTAKTVKYLASGSNSQIAIFNQFKPNTQYTIIWTTDENSTGGTANLKVEYTDGTSETLRYAESAGVKRQIVFVTSATKTLYRLRSVHNAGTAYLLYEESGIFEGVLTSDDFEQYNAQTLTISTPNGLHGIPVTSGGNYTDENGQQWVCDEVDFARGKYMQRIGKHTFDGTENLVYQIEYTNYKWYGFTASNMKNVGEVYSNSFISDAFSYRGSTSDVLGAFRRYNELRFSVPSNETAKNYIVGFSFIYELKTPVEHDLTAEELAQYATLHTNYPNTTILNDGSVYMEAIYSDVNGVPTANDSFGLVKSGGDVTISNGVITVNDDSHNHTIANVDNLQTTLDGKANKSQGVFYIEGDSSSSTDTTNKVATWIGSHDDITAYFNGLTILYKVQTAGSTTTTLNINGLGAVAVVRNATTAISTACPVGGVLLLTYTTDSDGTFYWKTADYDANTKNTAGTSNKTEAKMYLVGGTSQSSSGVTTYSNKNVYIGTDNCLYSNGEKVAISTEISTAINGLREEILGGEW